MNSIRQRRALTLIVGAVALAISPALGIPARAVTITGNTFASQTGGSPPASAANSYNMTNLTGVSANIRSDTTVSHAQSAASAVVGNAGVTKTTSGRAWTDAPTTTFNARGDIWNASATGTQIIANYTGLGSAPATVPFQFALPAQIPLLTDPFYNASGQPANSPPPGYTDPTAMLLPVSGTTPANQTVAQGAIANGSGTLPSFFDVYVDVEANALFNGTTTPLFSGTYIFNPVTGQFTGTGDFDQTTNNSPVKLLIPPPNTTDSTKPEYSLGFAQDITSQTYPTTFNAPVGQQFSVFIDTSIMMGDPSHPDNTDFDYSNASAFGGAVGIGGSVTAQFMLPTELQSQFMVQAVPEPSTLCLAAIAGVALLWQRRRRRS